MLKKARKLWLLVGLAASPLIIATVIAYYFPQTTVRGLRVLHVPVLPFLGQRATDSLIAQLEKRAAVGDCSAQYQLAVQLHARQFPRQYYAIAMEGDARRWLIRSAENGCVDGMTELARYADEAGDYREGVQWYTKAAELGDPYSEWTIGRYYEDGDGVPRDLDKALQWFKRAQNSGFRAESDIASVYAEQQDLIEAHQWYTRALEAADPFAAQQLGQCYKYGDACRGVCDWRKPCPRDPYKAYLWLRVASLYGNCPTCYREITPLLSLEQVSKAETEAAAWVKNHPKAQNGP